MPKINVYVPYEMKARMDKAEKSANWSAVAQRAFDLELNHLESITEVKSMEDTIERLRASKKSYVEAQIPAARAAGVEWAQRYATYEQLRDLNHRFGDTSTYGHDAETTLDLSAHNGGLPYEVYTTIDDDGSPRENDLIELFGLDFADHSIKDLTDEWAAGFVEGALDVWEKVEDQI